MEAGNDIFEVISELERSLEEAKRVPLTNQCIIDRTAVLGLVQMVRDSVPEAIKNGNRIMGQESRILGDAKKHYENVTAEAEAKAKKLRMESEQRAQATVSEATQHAHYQRAA